MLSVYLRGTQGQKLFFVLTGTTRAQPSLAQPIDRYYPGMRLLPMPCGSALALELDELRDHWASRSHKLHVDDLCG